MLCGDETNAVVVDLGAFQCRFGTAGQDLPRYNFSSFSSAPYDAPSSVSVGDHSLRLVRERQLVNPIFHGPEINWDAVEQVMKYGMVDQMRLNPENYAVMLSQGKYFRSPEAQKKMMEICYERLHVPAMYFMDENVLSAFCMGRRSCLVVDLSGSAASVTPVVDGYSLRKSSVMDENLGGSMNHSFHSSLVEYHRMEIVRDMKHSMTFIPHYRVGEEYRSLEGLQNLGVVVPSPYVLPDGTMVSPYYELCTMAEQLFFPERKPAPGQVPEPVTTTVGKKRSRSVGSKETAPSAPFSHPLLSNTATASLADMVYKSIVLSDVDVRRELLANIVVVGGHSLLSGMTQRLQRELDDAVVSQLKAKVHIRLPIERKFSSWIGGSILSICGSFQQCWVSKHQYDEHGPDRCAVMMAVH